MPELTCSTCRHFRLADHQASGECHRYAPRPNVVAPIVVGLGLAALPVWPTVLNSDSCGEWSPAKRANADKEGGRHA